MKPTLSYHPTAIMARIDTLYHLTDAYFGLTPIPTPAGLARHLGFASVPALLEAAQNPDHSQEARDALTSALTTLEDILTQGGLTERTHPAFTKYIMQSRLSVVEPAKAAEDSKPIQINILGIGNTTIQSLL